MMLETPQDVIRHGQKHVEKAGNGVARLINRAVQAGDEESMRDLHAVIGALSAVRDSLELLLIRLDR